MSHKFAIREIGRVLGQSYLALVYADSGAIVHGQKMFVLRSDASGPMTATVTLELRGLKLWHEDKT
jgi:hypothetical protein